MKKQILIAIAIFALIGGSYAFWMFNKPHENIEKAKVFQHFTSEQLLNQFENNHDKSDALLQGNVISIEGEISDIKKTEDQILVLMDHGGDFILLAYFNGAITNFNGLKVGKTIKFKGKYAGTIINDDDFLIPADIKIEECYLVI